MSQIALSDPEFFIRLRSGIDAYSPGCEVLSMRPLLGGISAQMMVVELRNTGGEVERIVVRQPGLHVNDSADGVAKEFELLLKLVKTGLPTPQPLLIEADNSTNDQFYTMSFIDGKPDLNPQNPTKFLKIYAKTLAEIHLLNLEEFELTNVRRLKNPWTPKGESLDHELLEGEIRNVLESSELKVDSNPEVLRHGDLWPGNLLWNHDELAGVVDWENASLGHPLLDLSISRLDILWILGWEAMESFTSQYIHNTGFDPTNLAYFDLVVALRPVHSIAEFASAYPDLGRPDITKATLVRDHNQFVRSAIASHQKGC